jgi:predicted nucleic acid-binding protein
MNQVFADTLYWLAIVRPGDSWRDPAQRARALLGPVRLVTTDEVLTEFLAAVSSGGPLLRRKAVETVRMLLTDPDMTVMAQSRDTFIHALGRYAQREDKEYSLTDCSAMNAMDGLGIRDILTNDHHFEPEGYNVLIKKS